MAWRRTTMTDAPRPTPHGEELPPEEGIRSDHAGTSVSPSGVAPGGEAVRRADDRIEAPREEDDADPER
jgi:hypothetical protein